jgi:pimeloyl-ACP methyl ester carboxylesterase
MGTTAGYAHVNGLALYHEVAGEGFPLVLLHGGVMTIDLSFAGLIPGLVDRHRVVAVELQGHGRTADVDRERTPASSASDVVALLDHLGVERADVLGHSMGGEVALELAVSYPQRVRRVVPMGVWVRPEGMHADLRDPARFATSTRLPTAQDYADMREAYTRLSPHPERFDAFFSGSAGSAAEFPGWTDAQLAGITAPVLLVQGDHDFTTIEHAGLMLELIPGAQLAVLPGTTHMQVTRRVDLLLPIVRTFLADGAAA